MILTKQNLREIEDAKKYLRFNAYNGNPSSIYTVVIKTLQPDNNNIECGYKLSVFTLNFGNILFTFFNFRIINNYKIEFSDVELLAEFTKLERDLDSGFIIAINDEDGNIDIPVRYGIDSYIDDIINRITKFVEDTDEINEIKIIACNSCEPVSDIVDLSYNEDSRVITINNMSKTSVYSFTSGAIWGLYSGNIKECYINLSAEIQDDNNTEYKKTIAIKRLSFFGESHIVTKCYVTHIQEYKNVYENDKRFFTVDFDNREEYDAFCDYLFDILKEQSKLYSNLTSSTVTVQIIFKLSKERK